MREIKRNLETTANQERLKTKANNIMNGDEVEEKEEEEEKEEKRKRRDGGAGG